MIRDRLLLFGLFSGSRMAARPKCTVKFNSRLSLSSAILRTDWHVLSKFKSLDIIPTINDDQSEESNKRSDLVNAYPLLIAFSFAESPVESIDFNKKI